GLGGRWAIIRPWRRMPSPPCVDSWRENLPPLVALHAPAPRPLRRCLRRTDAARHLVVAVGDLRDADLVLGRVPVLPRHPRPAGPRPAAAAREARGAPRRRG